MMNNNCITDDKIEQRLGQRDRAKTRPKFKKKEKVNVKFYIWVQKMNCTCLEGAHLPAVSTLLVSTLAPGQDSSHGPDLISKVRFRWGVGGGL